MYYWAALLASLLYSWVGGVIRTDGTIQGGACPGPEGELAWAADISRLLEPGCVCY